MARTTIIVNCQNCGKEFQVEPHILKHGKGKTCSKKCRYELISQKQSQHLFAKCQRCGKEFKTIKSNQENGLDKYCSKECCFPPLFKACANCGKEFRYSPSHGDTKYCSKKCMDNDPMMNKLRSENVKKAWLDSEKRSRFMEGIKRRSESEEWRATPHFQKGIAHPHFKGNRKSRQIAVGRYEYIKWRKDVFRKDNYTCQSCGIRGGRLQAHHVKSWAEYPDLRYEVSNGLTVCEDCHNKIHGDRCKVSMRTCAYCNEKFQPQKKSSKYCNRECYLNDKKDRH